ncbi:UDP-glucuronosyltransferase 1-3 isoform X1 [Anoplophora glabripennis]|nr:UDP-glucuronosyltransferase 1-3 isoform X1 [Anoplophora glabripennis]
MGYNETMKTSIVLVLLTLLTSSSGLNILGVFPHLGKSHADVFITLMKGLAQKGHTVTVISHFPLSKSIPNYKDIDLGGRSQAFVELLPMDVINPGSRLQMIGNVFLLSYFANISCEVGFSSPAMQKFLKTDEKFDLLIIEFFNSDCFMGLTQKIKAPVIGLSSCTIMPWTSERLGNPTHTAYIPNNNMDYSDQMTFRERLENTVITLIHQAHYQYVTLSRDEEIARKYLGEEASRIREFIRNSSLLITNSHFTLNLPRPLVPGVVEVGGLHIGKTQPLPKNIEKWINESPEGVIYFALGSLIKGDTFPKEKRDVFLRAFSRLPQRVLWKWESETMEGKPDNVMIQKWMPQLDILCHPNVKAFISHGGLLGTIEAVHCGVPVVVMPQFGDQHTNARALEASGGGVILQLREATEDKVYKALKKVLSADSRQKAKDLSERFRDRPMPPLETAIYWVEYVARHKGAPYMRTAAVNMPFYKYYLIDVAAFLIFIVSIFIYILYKAVKYAIRIICKTKETKVKSS